MWMRSTMRLLANRKRNDSVIKSDSRSIFRSVARARNSFITTRVFGDSGHAVVFVLGELLAHPVIA